MNTKKGALPIFILLICCTLLSIWVWKNVPITNADTAADLTGLELTTFDLVALTAEEKPILLNFSSDSCPYCVVMAPDLKQIYCESQNSAVIREINLDRSPEAVMQLQGVLRATPTQMLFYADGSPYVPSEDIAKQMSFIYFTNGENGPHALTIHEGMLTAAQMRMILEDMGVVV